jgi:type IV secretory pathway VirD2 relaxase
MQSSEGRDSLDCNMQDKSSARHQLQVFALIGFFEAVPKPWGGASSKEVLLYQSSRRHRLFQGSCGMKVRDDDLRVRPGRIQNRPRLPNTFVGQVMQAARKAGYAGKGFGKRDHAGSSRFGRGRAAAVALSSHEPGRRVVVMNRIVRHQGLSIRSGPLARHIVYLKREGVTRDGADARMFDDRSDDADHKAFAARCEEDRHHFRFTVSPENAVEMADLRAFTRELMSDAERDLGTRLDWIAVDHWNTAHAHIHVLVRGRADDGKDLVISRDYISRGLHARAAERVTLELGPRNEAEIRSAIEREVNAERWTGLDRALLAISDEGGGLADLRPGSERGDAGLQQLLRGRTVKLQRLGLAQQVAPGQWILKPGLEQTLRALSIRGDIIKTMHRAMTSAGRAVDISGFALHGNDLVDPVIGRLVERGLHDELKCSAYAIIEGIDGRTHHLRFSELELTSDAKMGAIVEARAGGAKGKKGLSLAVGSDLTLGEQVSAPGATWLDRQLLAGDLPISESGFGAEVRDAMQRRTDHLVGAGLAKRQAQRVVFARGLLDTLRRRELDAAVGAISAETGLAHYPSAEGEHVAGQYRQRITLSSGRFAMIDDGAGFQLVRWQRSLDRHLGREVSGVMASRGVDWRFGRKRGLGL